VSTTNVESLPKVIAYSHATNSRVRTIAFRSFLLSINARA
jgi:hypothetical protein